MKLTNQSLIIIVIGALCISATAWTMIQQDRRHEIEMHQMYNTGIMFAYRCTKTSPEHAMLYSQYGYTCDQGKTLLQQVSESKEGIK